MELTKPNVVLLSPELENPELPPADDAILFHLSAALGGASSRTSIVIVSPPALVRFATKSGTDTFLDPAANDPGLGVVP